MPDSSKVSVGLLRKFLEKHLKGQPKAISSVCKVYSSSLSLRKLEPRKGPRGVFLFLGPSGVGKTELARLLNLFLNGHSGALTTIQCEGFSQPHMIHSLIGSPHGYIAFNDKPVLSQETITSRVLSKKMGPESVNVLLESKKTSLETKIESYQINLEDIINAISNQAILINALENYEGFLNDSNGNKDGKSLRELIREGTDTTAILEFLSTRASKIIVQSVIKPLDDMAVLLELYATTRNLIQDYHETSQELNKLFAEMAAIESRIKKPQKVSDPPLSTTQKPEWVVLLFDEIEKGNQTLHNLLLEIMEEGRVTLANGTITDLKNAFVILTGNMGARSIGSALKGKVMGFSGPAKQIASDQIGQMEQDIKKLEEKILIIAERELSKTFSPEFRRRIDEIIVFRPLPPSVLREILDQQIEEFAEVLRTHKLELIVEDGVREMVLSQSLHRPEIGASLVSHKLESLVKIPVVDIWAEQQSFQGRIRVVAPQSVIKIVLEKTP